MRFVTAIRFPASLAVAALSMLAAVANAASLDPALALRLKSAGDVAISPDGKVIAFRMNRARTESEPRGGAVGELWIVRAGGGTPERVTDGGFAAGQPQWSPDGKHLAWIAKPDPEHVAQVFVRPAEGGNATQQTRSAGDVVSMSWSHDSSRIGYIAWDAKSEKQRQDEKAGRDWIVMDDVPLHRRLYTVVVGSSTSTLVTRVDITVDDFDWSPDDRRFVLTAASSPSDDEQSLALKLYTVAASGGEPKRVLDQHGRISHPRWSADGESIAWLGSIAVHDPWAGNVFVMPADGAAAPRNLMSGYDGTATWLGSLPGRAEALAVLLEEHQRVALRSIELASGRMQPLSTPTAAIPGAPSFTRDGRTLAFAGSSPSHPAEVFTARIAKPTAATRVTDSNPELAGITLGAQEEARWKSKDGLVIEGVLIKPVGYVPGKRYPIVLHVHGGSEGISLNNWHGSYIDFGQLLAARGYAVLYPNYRGSRGRGTDFVRGNRHDLMGREWEDIEGALDHAIASGIGDGERAGIYGFSWGGYAAGWGATFASHRFKAAVGGAGIYNWISEAGANDTRMHEQFAHWDSPLYEDFLLYLDRSPIYHVRKANTPILLLHGEMDPSCPINQAIEMHTALKWKGVPVELVIYPREGHGMSEPAHQEDFLARGLGWLDRYLKP